MAQGRFLRIESLGGAGYPRPRLLNMDHIAEVWMLPDGGTRFRQANGAIDDVAEDFESVCMRLMVLYGYEITASLSLERERAAAAEALELERARVT